jgi:predicted nucleotidyltransferase component of viral defense system
VILKESHSKEWIEGIWQKNKIDPTLIEKVIFALTLVEQLQISGLDFIFKGGTSLILLLGEPKRLSIDIDIIVNPQHRALLESALNLLVGQGVFERYEKNEREAKTDIPKAHYKFYYQSNYFTNIQYILLDVLFEESPYTQTMNIPVCSEFVSCDEKTIKVKIPSLNCILGDKLTAFAPNTTGIPYDIDKELEIIKQLFDIATLFDLGVCAGNIS